MAQQPKLPMLSPCFVCLCNAFFAIAHHLRTDLAEAHCSALLCIAAHCCAFPTRECGSSMCGGNRLRCPGAAAVYLLSAYVCLEFWVEWVPFVVFLGLWVLWMLIRRWHRCHANCVCRGCHLCHEHFICASWTFMETCFVFRKSKFMNAIACRKDLQSVLV